jgi:hypothetical protein
MPPRQHPMVRMLARQLERLHDRGLIEQKDKKVIKDAIDTLKGESNSPVVSDEETAAIETLAEHKASLPNRCPTCGRITLIKPTN